MSPKLSKEAVDDPLWKSVLEQTFVHFLTFFFPEADKIFDLSKKFVYLDKELQSMFPPMPHNKGVRYVDKLVRVSLRGGGEKYVLIHVEAQSAKGHADLALRMYEYYSLIVSKHRVPVTAIAILADSNAGYHPRVYEQEFLGTRFRYEFNSYKILGQDEAALRDNPNPFAVVVLTALMALRHTGADDSQLLDIKHDLYDQMMLRKMDKKERRAIYDFLTYYVQFEKPEMIRKFEEQIKEKQGRSTTVGTREYLLDKAKREGIEKGIEQGLEQGKRETLFEIALNLLKKGISIDVIAESTGLAKDQIEKLRYN